MSLRCVIHDTSKHFNQNLYTLKILIITRITCLLIKFVNIVKASMKSKLMLPTIADDIDNDGEPM